MESVVGAVVAALFGIATLRKVQLQDKKIVYLHEKIDTLDLDLSKKVMATMYPVAKEVKALKDTVGV
jgi:Cu/Ag efflux protein CusF